MDSLPPRPEAGPGAGAYPHRPSAVTRRKSAKWSPPRPMRTPEKGSEFHDVGSPSTITNQYQVPYYPASYGAGIMAEDVEPSRGKGYRGHFVAATGEFVGTFMFLWFAFAGQTMVIQQASDSAIDGSSSAQTIVFISLIYGLSLLVNAWGWYRISGGLFNPAVCSFPGFPSKDTLIDIFTQVTLGLCLSGGLPWIRGVILVPFQLFGGLLAAGLVSAMFPGPIDIVQTTLSPHTSKAQGLFIEMILTSLLVFMILMLAAEKTKVTFLAPLGIGLSLFVALLAGGFYTGGSLNPARTLGPAIAARNFTPEHWIYWMGPAMGACLAAGYYRLIKLLHYEEANPDQDSSGGDFLEK
ncbi:hypothetical protein FKW77_006093 [Venturia effusa]|uniref:Aquaporin n=1 Tax=Venturia effusa TaxID=50376 RepID=A0A517LQ97_9PEZI|nr:hypothetical protein FKW77_006093 [Venturia effusa]